jgi:hypothetical protein
MSELHYLSASEARERFRARELERERPWAERRPDL